MNSLIFHFQISLSMGFIYWFYICFQVLNCFINFLPLLVCVFIDFFNELIFSFADFYHIHENYFNVFFCCILVVLQYLGPALVEFLGPGGDIHYYMLIIVFLGWHLDIWFWEDYIILGTDI